MTLDEWETTFEWLATDMEGNATLLSNSNTPPAIRKLLESAGTGLNPHLPTSRVIWSQQDADNGGYEIVPGFYPNAIGWYVTRFPWVTGDELVVIPPTEEG